MKRALLLVLFSLSAAGQDLGWDHDYPAAVERARAERRPLFVLVAWPKPG